MTSQLDSQMSSMEAVVTWTRYDTVYGPGWIGAAGDEVVRLVLPGCDRPETGAIRDDESHELASELSAYFCGVGRLPDGARFISAAATTDLDAEIYRVVTAIPAGETMTYARVAEKVGRPGAARAVGAAMAKNRFAPTIPCHRVVGSDGSLRGYAGGLAMKRALLDMEAAHA